MKVHNPLPESLSIHCQKAASILDHFVKGTTKLDATFIPSKILEKARGVAIITIVKAGFVWSGRAGTGLVVARLQDGSWSAPSAIMAFGAGVGAQIGAEITDYVFVLNNAAAVRAFSLGGNFTLGGNISVAAGPTGRATEAAGALVNLAPIYSYSKSKGLFAGVSLEGTVIVTRNDANKYMYGAKVRAVDLLSGSVPPPVEADPLYRMLGFSRFANVGKRMIVGGQPAYEEATADRMAKSSSVSSGIGGTNAVGSASIASGLARGATLRPRNSDSDAEFQRGKKSQDDTNNNSSAADARVSETTIRYNGNNAVVATEPALPPQVNAERAAAIRAKLLALSPKPTTPLPPSSSSSIAAVGPTPKPPPKPITLSAKSHSLPRSSSPNHNPNHTTTKTATALFDFTAQRRGDLSFKEGDMITVTKSTDSQDDWWSGSVNGVSGDFPANYVRLVA